MAQNPLAPPPPAGNPEQDKWLYLLWRRLTQAGQIFWSSLDFSGSNITDLATRNHEDLQNLNTTDYTHLTNADATDLTDGGLTQLHRHSHSLLSDLDGGLSTQVFEPTAFEETAFQMDVVEYFHVSENAYNETNRVISTLTTAIDVTVTDEYATVIVTASAVTVTLPKAIPTRVGLQWTIVQNCTGYVDIVADPLDTILLPTGNDNIRLTQIGNTLTIVCVSTSSWVIT